MSIPPDRIGCGDECRALGCGLRHFLRQVFPWVLVVVLAGGCLFFFVRYHLPLRREVKLVEQSLRAAGEDAEDCESQIAGIEEEKWRLVRRAEELEAEAESCRAQRSELKEEVERKTRAMKALESTAEELASRLQKEIRSGEVKIKHEKGQLSVDLSDRIMFDSAEVELNQRGREVLQRVGQTLRKTSDKIIQVGGHTDSVPISDKLKERFPSNWELSAARAAEVVRFLMEEVGIPGERLMAAGYARYRPVASNKSRRGRRLNRRIELVLLPLPDK